MRKVIEIELGKCTCVNCGFELFLNPIIDHNQFMKEFNCSQCDKLFFIKQEENKNVEQTIE